jgi:hypothetical protein
MGEQHLGYALSMLFEGTLVGPDEMALADRRDGLRLRNCAR